MHDETLAFPESICSWLQQDKEIMDPLLHATAESAVPAPSQACCYVSECMATASKREKRRCKGVEVKALNENFLLSPWPRVERSNILSFLQIHRNGVTICDEISSKDVWSKYIFPGECLPSLVGELFIGRLRAVSSRINLLHECPSLWSTTILMQRFTWESCVLLKSWADEATANTCASHKFYTYCKCDMFNNNWEKRAIFASMCFSFRLYITLAKC